MANRFSQFITAPQEQPPPPAAGNRFGQFGEPDEPSPSGNRFAAFATEDTSYGAGFTRIGENLPARGRGILGGLVEWAGRAYAPDTISAQTRALARIEAELSPEEQLITGTDSPALRILAEEVARGDIVAAGSEMRSEAQAELAANQPQTGGDPVKGFVFDTTRVVLEMLPMLATFIATKKLVPAASPSVAPAAGLGVMGAQVYGDAFGRARESGRNPDEASQDALFAVLSEVLPESTPLGILTKQGGKLLTRLFKGSAAEGVQEGITQIIQSGYDYGVLDEDMTWGDFVNRVGYAMALGGAAGASLGVIAHPFVRGGEEPPPGAPPSPPGIAPSAPGEAVSPPPDIPPPGAGVVLATPDGTPARATVDGYSDDGRDVTLRYDGGAREVVPVEDMLRVLQTVVPTVETPETAAPVIPPGSVAPTTAEAMALHDDLARAAEIEEAQAAPETAAPVIPPGSVAPTAAEAMALHDDLARAAEIEEAQAAAAMPPPAQGALELSPAEVAAQQRAQAPMAAPAVTPAPVQGTGTRDNPVVAPQTTEEVDAAAAQAEQPKSEAQAEAGNYKKGYVKKLFGQDFTFETPRGEERRGPEGPDGKPIWVTVHPTAHYGEIPRTEGGDGEGLDVYIAPDLTSTTAYVVDQIDPKTGEFDEHKIVFGTTSMAAAQTVYDEGFSDGSGPSRRGAITEMTLDEFKEWKRGDTTKAVAYVKPTGATPPPAPEAPVVAPAPVSGPVADLPVPPTPYSPDLNITNIDAMPRGSGARYLLALQGEDGQLVAKQWKRVVPKTLGAGEVLVDMKPSSPAPEPAAPQDAIAPDEAERVAQNLKRYGFIVFGEEYVYYSPLRPLGFGFPIKSKDFDRKYIPSAMPRDKGAVDPDRVLVTAEPISTAQMHRLDLFPTSPAARVAALKDAYAATPGAKPGRYELRDPERMESGRAVGITPSADEPGRIRLSWFDADGFSGDMTEATMDDALSEAIGAGFTLPWPGHLADMAQLDSFQQGNDRTMARKREAAPAPEPALPPLVPDDTAITARGEEVPVLWALREVADLVTSNTDDGRIDPAYPAELQPRDRNRKASAAQIEEIVRKPEPRKLGPNPNASDGAPIIGRDNVVEAGNGRVIGLRRIYGGENEDGARRYRAFLESEGHDTSGMAAPVLVRVRTSDLTPEERAALVPRFNDRTTLGMSATEQAMADAAALTDSALGLYRGGDVDAAANREFVRSFVRTALPASEHASFFDAEGAMSQEGVRRVQAALLARAYGDADVVASLIEATDTNTKAIGGALLDVAGDWAAMRGEAERGDINPASDITPTLVEAVTIVRRARTEKRHITEFVKQRGLLAGDAVSPMAEEFLRIFYRGDGFSHARGRVKVAGALLDYVQNVRETKPTAGLFGASDMVSPEEIMEGVRGRLEEDEAPPQHGGLFDQSAGAESIRARGAGQRPAEAGEGRSGPERDPGGRPARGAAAPAPAAAPQPVAPDLPHEGHADPRHLRLYRYGQHLAEGGAAKQAERNALFAALHGFVEGVNRPADIDQLALEYYDDVVSEGPGISLVDPDQAARYAIKYKDFEPRFARMFRAEGPRGAANENAVLAADEEMRRAINRMVDESPEGQAFYGAIADGKADAAVYARGWGVVESEDGSRTIRDEEFADVATIRRLPSGGFSLNVLGTDIAERFGSYPEAVAWVLGVEPTELDSWPPAETKFARVPTFFSALTRGIEAVQQPKAGAAQWKGIIKKLPGVKAEELAWSNVEDWLDRQDGAVTKDALVEYLHANEMRVEEVVKGSTQERRDLQARLSELARLGGDRTLAQDAEYERLAQRLNAGQAFGGEPKFEAHALPGGENYREVLLTLPVAPPTPAAPAGRIEQLLNGKFLVTTPGGERRVFDTRAEAEAERTRLGNLFNKPIPAPGTFTEGHFNEPNVLVHVRFNERTDAAGQRTLFIEEIQSDWHQKGRRQGYKGPSPVPRYMVRMGDEVIGRFDTEEGALAAAEEAGPRASAHQLPAGGTTGVPDAPFKTTWHELGFKRMLRWAAENGHDAVAWTTGEQQAERYDYSTQVESITVAPRHNARTGERTRGIVIMPVSMRDSIELGIDNNGVVDNASRGAQEMNGKPLADVVGKEMADKIMAVEGSEKFTGLDLKVGGVGLKAFYDRIMVNYANKLGKRFGAKVGTAEIPQPPFSALYPDETSLQGEPATVHSLPITPEMRESVMAGLPLFARPGAPVRSSVAPTASETTRIADDLIGVNDLSTPAAVRRDAVRTAMRKVLEDMVGPADIEVFDELVHTRRDGTAREDVTTGAAYTPDIQLVTASLSAPGDLAGRIRHEAIHFLRRMGVIDPRHWAMLERKAEREWIKRYDIENLYPASEGFTREQQREEAIAFAYPEWKDGGLKAEGLVKRALERIHEFLTRLAMALRGAGWRNWRDVFADIERGKYRGQDTAVPGYRFERTEQGDVVVVDAMTGARVSAHPTRIEATDAARVYTIEDALGRDGVTAMEEKFAGYAEVEADRLGPTQFARNYNDALPPMRRSEMREPGTRYLSAIGRYLAFPRGFAAVDWRSAQYWLPYKRSDEYRQTLENRWSRMLARFDKLDREGKDRVHAVEEMDRLAGRTRRPTGMRLIVGNDGLFRTALSRPNETVRLSQAETDAYFDRRELFRDIWNERIQAAVRRVGYKGEISPEGFNQALTAATASRDRGEMAALYRAAGLYQMMEAQRRAGYVPLIRYGNHMISVRPLPEEGAETGGGRPELEWFELVDATPPFASIIGRTVKEGRTPKKVAARIEELRQKYPEDQYEIDDKPVDPKVIDSLSIPALEKLVMAMAQDQPGLYEALADKLLTDVYDEIKAGWHKQARNIPGYSTDFERAVGDYVRGAASTTARMAYRDELDRAYERIQGPGGHPSRHVKAFWKKFRERQDSNSGDWALARKLGFVAFLWASPASAVVNLSQTMLLTTFNIGTWAGQARAQALVYPAFSEALAAVRPMARGFALDIDKLGKTDAEKAMLNKLNEDGTLTTQLTAELSGMNAMRNPRLRSNARAFDQAFDIGASMFGSAEQVNRAAAALAAFRAAHIPALRAKANETYRDNELYQAILREAQSKATAAGASKIPDTLDPTTLAQFMVDETQFVMGKINRQHIATGPGAALLQFRSFQMNYLRSLYQLAARQGAGGKVAASMMLLALLAMSGLWGEPFAEDVRDIAEAIYKFATGVDVDLDRMAREGMVDAGFGQIGAEMVMRGGSRELFGVDWSLRVGQGGLLPDPTSGDALGVLYAWTVGRAIEAKRRLDSGQPITAAATLMPKGLGDFVKGTIAMPYEGLSTQRGNIVILPSEITAWDRVTRILGFASAKQATRGEERRSRERLEDKLRDVTSTWYTVLARHTALEKDARERGDFHQAAIHADKLEALEEMLQAHNENPLVPDELKIKITTEALKNRVKTMLHPDEAQTEGASTLVRERLAEESIFPNR